LPLAIATRFRFELPCSAAVTISVSSRQTIGFGCSPRGAA
jgi:hypothetical protein